MATQRQNPAYRLADESPAASADGGAFSFPTGFDLYRQHARRILAGRIPTFKEATWPAH